MVELYDRKFNLRSNSPPTLILSSAAVKIRPRQTVTDPANPATCCRIDCEEPGTLPVHLRETRARWQRAASKLPPSHSSVCGASPHRSRSPPSTAATAARAQSDRILRSAARSAPAPMWRPWRHRRGSVVMRSTVSPARVFEASRVRHLLVGGRSGRSDGGTSVPASSRTAPVTFRFLARWPSGITDRHELPLAVAVEFDAQLRSVGCTIVWCWSRCP